MAQRAAVTTVLVGQVGTGVVRAYWAVVRVPQRAPVGRSPGGEGAIVLRGSDGMQAVDWVVIVG